MEQNHLKIDHQHPSLLEHIQSMMSGFYAIPEFQRTFVWDEKQILKLWESLYNGFPIGQIMLWEPSESLNFPMRTIGKYPQKSQHGKCAIIDGQQRLTAIYSVLKNDDDINLRFDLKNKKFTFNETGIDCLSLCFISGLNNSDIIKANIFERGMFRYHATTYQKSKYEKEINILNSMLTSVQIPYQKIKNSNYGTIVKIFQRLNTQGSQLNQAQITMALLSERWPGVFNKTYDLLKKLNDEINFDRADEPTFVFQVLAAVHTKQHLIKHLAPQDSTSQYYKSSNPKDYEESWKKTTVGIEGLIKLLIKIGLCNFKFIKATYPLSVVSHYLATHNTSTKEELDKLEKWLILSLISGRYSGASKSKGGSASKYRADIQATTARNPLTWLFSHNNEPIDPDSKEALKSFSKDKIKNEGFNSSYSTLLYLLIKKLGGVDLLAPEIKIDDDINIEFHHIFPRELFKSKLKELEDIEQDDEKEESVRVKASNDRQDLERKISSIGNLAFITGNSNKKISDRKPSDYLKEILAADNGEDILNSQLIPSKKELWEFKNFNGFLDERLDMIISHSKKLLPSQKPVPSKVSPPTIKKAKKINKMIK